jgi:16S rRNA processing protein RimM
MTSRSAGPRKGDAERPPRRRPVAPDAERVAAGRVLAAHGLRGELAVEVLSDVAGRFAPGSALLLTAPGAPPHPVTVRASRPHKGALLVTLAGVEDRTAAEALRGALLEVDAAAVPPAPEGSYYHFDLVGCRCVAGDGDLGEVVEVVEGGGGILLRVVGGHGELLLPFVDSYLGEVDVAARRIEWRLPEGFVEACGSAS